MSDTNNALVQAAINQNYRDGASITPDNAGTHNYNALVAGVAGNVAVDFLGGGTNIVVALAAGIPVNYKVTRVYATGTTATGIVGLNAR
jgi:hypothetical protein